MRRGVEGHGILVALALVLIAGPLGAEVDVWSGSGGGGSLGSGGGGGGGERQRATAVALLVIHRPALGMGAAREHRVLEAAEAPVVRAQAVRAAHLVEGLDDAVGAGRGARLLWEAHAHRAQEELVRRLVAFVVVDRLAAGRGAACGDRGRDTLELARVVGVVGHAVVRARTQRTVGVSALGAVGGGHGRADVPLCEGDVLCE